MRVIFLGTPEFAVPSLQALLDIRYEVMAVFTQPDRPSGRGHRVRPSPVKVCAEKHGIPVYQPPKIRLEENRPIFARIAPDFIVVVAYGQILPAWLLQSARVASVNVHGSILPRYRGAAPIAWTILNGETVSGVTTMLMVEKLDAGPVFLSREVSVGADTNTGELTELLAPIGATLLIDTLDRLAVGSIQPLPQDENLVTWAPRITKEMSTISWERSAREVHNQVRGLNPRPAAYTVWRTQRLQIWRSAPAEAGSALEEKPGTVVGLTEAGILVQCGGRTVIEVLEVQAPGRARVSGRAFANGARMLPRGAVFGSNSSQ